MPAYMSSVTIAGRLAKDPELSFTQTQLPVCSIVVAVNEYFSSKKHTSFFDCSLSGKNAELVCEFLNKGDGIVLSGRLVQDRWTGKDGKKRYEVRIRANRMTFGERHYSKKDGYKSNKTGEEYTREENHDSMEEVPF